MPGSHALRTKKAKTHLNHCNTPRRRVILRRIHWISPVGFFLFLIPLAPIYANAGPMPAPKDPSPNLSANYAWFGSAMKTVATKTKQLGAITASPAAMTDPKKREEAASLKKQIAAVLDKSDAIAQSSPQVAKIQQAAGALALQAGDYKKGLEYAQKAVALAQAQDDEKELEAALRTRAIGELWSGDYPAAAEDARKALALAPQDRNAQAVWHFARGRARAGGETA
ncbi:MAG: hypothetical protein KGM24_12985, partial [Elusimicrobia bacterium]|nr:hypothetical protein [Elusimicrobiota bacterium]